MRPSQVCAIDPGVNGAFVVTDGHRIKTWPMPIKVEGRDKRIDFAGVYELMIAIHDRYGLLHVFLERAIPMAQGAKSAFSYGRGFEALIIAIEFLKFPLTLVEPQKWAKEMHEGISNDLKPKVKSLAAVKRLYPHLVALLPTRPKGGIEDGPIDALLIAGYALRTGKVAPVKPNVGDFF